MSNNKLFLLAAVAGGAYYYWYTKNMITDAIPVSAPVSLPPINAVDIPAYNERVRAANMVAEAGRLQALQMRVDERAAEIARMQEERALREADRLPASTGHLRGQVATFEPPLLPLVVCHSDGCTAQSQGAIPWRDLTGR